MSTRLEEFRQQLRDEAARLTERADKMEAERAEAEASSSPIRDFKMGQCSGAAVELRYCAWSLLRFAEDKEEFGVNISSFNPDYGVRFSVGVTRVWP